MYKTPVRNKTRHKAYTLTNGHGGLKMNAKVLKTLKKNAQRIVAKSVAKARVNSIATYLRKKRLQTTGLTFLLGICSGAAIGYLVDKNKSRRWL